MPNMGFRELTEFISSYAKERNFIPLTLGVEKHGSWEWMMYWNDHKQLNKYIAVYLLESNELLSPPRFYHIEVWAGADDDQRYTRQRISFFAVAENQLHDQRYFARLADDLDVARNKAESFTTFDLIQIYIPSRPR